ncbi:MAG TPA: hypothetical protein VHD36_14215 [Pirellulales bacterium]|nr:hypothetical protein [Pirellulales bacterium]
MWATLKRLLLLFWAVWLGLVVVFNVADALKALDVLPTTFVWASGNYGAILEVLAPFDLPDWFAGFLFGGVIVWETIGAALYALCAWRWRAARGRDGQRLLAITFMTSLGLWAAFQIACEVFPSELAYRLGATHRLLFTETLATLLAIMLLPDE